MTAFQSPQTFEVSLPESISFGDRLAVSIAVCFEPVRGYLKIAKPESFRVPEWFPSDRVFGRTRPVCAGRPPLPHYRLLLQPTHHTLLPQAARPQALGSIQHRESGRGDASAPAEKPKGMLSTEFKTPILFYFFTYWF